MEFCPKCNSILTPQKDKKKRVLICPQCGHRKRLSSKSKKKYRLGNQITHGPEEEIVVIDEELAKQQTMPTVRAICPKCENKEAYYWQVQTRSGDEAMTTFYRCVKCRQTWRDY
jgi:DNA-directed RNA polymerase subunit M